MKPSFLEPPSLPNVPPIESPFYEETIGDITLNAHQRRIADDLHKKGYAIIQFPDEEIDARAERLIETLSPEFDIEGWRTKGWKTQEGLRLQDAWDRLDDVRAIATNNRILNILSRIYGRQAFAFQTLNFPVGTQQRAHSDAVHFSSVPERFMVGVWVALEDIGPDQGPLLYYPGSHKWPMIRNEMVDEVYAGDPQAAANHRYREYIRYWQAMAREQGVEPEYFHAKKGQALIWSANLLHGGSAHKDPTKTRWSQVTHYYFQGCTYYVPRMSDSTVGHLHLKKPVDVATGKPIPHTYLGKPLKEIDPRG
ncbi:MAG: phytanoyl-CoA dioxygenase family protein [Pseudomonadota bacterium]